MLKIYILAKGWKLRAVRSAELIDGRCSKEILKTLLKLIKAM